MKPAAVAGGWWGHEMCACANASVERFVLSDRNLSLDKLVGVDRSAFGIFSLLWLRLLGRYLLLFLLLLLTTALSEGCVPSIRASKSAPTGSWQDQLRINMNNIP